MGKIEELKLAAEKVMSMIPEEGVQYVSWVQGDFDNYTKKANPQTILQMIKVIEAAKAYVSERCVGHYGALYDSLQDLTLCGELHSETKLEGK